MAEKKKRTIITPQMQDKCVPVGAERWCGAGSLKWHCMVPQDFYFNAVYTYFQFLFLLLNEILNFYGLYVFLQQRHLYSFLLFVKNNNI